MEGPLRRRPRSSGQWIREQRLFAGGQSTDLVPPDDLGKEVEVRAGVNRSRCVSQGQVISTTVDGQGPARRNGQYPVDLPTADHLIEVSGCVAHPALPAADRQLEQPVCVDDMGGVEIVERLVQSVVRVVAEGVGLRL